MSDQAAKLLLKSLAEDRPIVLFLGQAAWSICDELVKVLHLAVAAADNLFSTEDGARLTDELRKRLTGHWEAYRFDEHVESSAKLLGYEGIDIPLFRNRYLAEWRRVVEAAEPAKRDHLIRLRIEADLLAEMANALPLTAMEAMVRAKLKDGAELGAAMLLIRQAARNNRADIARVLEEAFPSAGDQPAPTQQTGSI